MATQFYRLTSENEGIAWSFAIMLAKREPGCFYLTIPAEGVVHSPEDASDVALSAPDSRPMDTAVRNDTEPADTAVDDTAIDDTEPADTAIADAADSAVTDTAIEDTTTSTSEPTLACGSI